MVTHLRRALGFSAVLGITAYSVHADYVNERDYGGGSPILLIFGVVVHAGPYALLALPTRGVRSEERPTPMTQLVGLVILILLNIAAWLAVRASTDSTAGMLFIPVVFAGWFWYIVVASLRGGARAEPSRS